MSTIRLQTNQHRLIANLRHAFTPRSMLGELLQNARRAKASRIDVTVTDDTLTISDNGCGIADLQTLIFIAESGWDKATQSRENAFGLGVLSTLYFAKTLRVHSGEQAFEADTAAIIRGDSINVEPQPARTGTQIRLSGVQPPEAGISLIDWVIKELSRLCQAFPVPVFCNGKEMERPLADSTLPWRKTRMGQVLIDLSAQPCVWRSFLQGLPIGETYAHGRYQAVLLPDSTLARLPDRQHLLNVEQDKQRIQRAVDSAYRAALMEVKAALSAEDFIAQYGRICLDSGNADLLNDIPFVPLHWFRNWNNEPAGFRKDWNHYHTDGLASRKEVEARGVWRIDKTLDEEDTLAAQVYLQAANALLLDGVRLNLGHWLHQIVKPVIPQQVQVSVGEILHRTEASCLEADVSLALVDTLFVSMQGEPEVAVDAIRHDGVLYLTTQADAPTQLVSNYIFDDCYEESLEEADADRLRAFVQIACAQSPAGVLAALLPSDLRYTPQSKLANATVRLSFDKQGRLVSVE